MEVVDHSWFSPRTYAFSGLHSATDHLARDRSARDQSPTRSCRRLIPTQLDRLAKITGGELHGNPSGLLIDRVCTDSRGAAPGAIFVALRGEHVDGHRFVEDAFRNGASAALVSALASTPASTSADH